MLMPFNSPSKVYGFKPIICTVNPEDKIDKYVIIYLTYV